MYKLIRFVTPKNEFHDGYAAYLHEQGRQLLTGGLSAYYGIDFSEDMIFYGEKGKPYIKDAFLNISHTDGLICAALSDNENGSDCEKIKAPRDGVLRRCFSEKEAEYIRKSTDPALVFTRLWTLKEAYSKLVGEGISVLKTVVFDLDNNHADFDCGCDFYQYIINESYAVVFCEKVGSGKVFLENVNFENEKAMVSYVI
ncbi:MAG: 4'-phosphopantetheinyl transferase superfamily protein [Eubacterium sp.]|nr:4'-phosphopantetheinyl transferase superfamily protein [Eubacterium sp.]